MTLLRHIVGALATPTAIVLLVALAALVARLIRRQRASRILLLCAAALAYLFSTSLVGRGLLYPLERQFAPLGATPPPVDYIVVLGSGYEPRDGIPVTAALDDDGLTRVVEAVRLARMLPGSRLLVSGGAESGRVPAAQGYARMAQALGVPQQSLIVSAQALNTGDEARAVQELLGRSAFLLVTSAYHMPRAMSEMRRAGANPIAAPTGQRAFGTRVTLHDFLPGSAGLRDSERALHEYAGLAADAVGVG
jgi:uncharacterized SAM-binding protein YcdF (DUF218 family)